MATRAVSLAPPVALGAGGSKDVSSPYASHQHAVCHFHEFINISVTIGLAKTRVMGWRTAKGQLFGIQTVRARSRLRRGVHVAILRGRLVAGRRVHSVQVFVDELPAGGGGAIALEYGTKSGTLFDTMNVRGGASGTGATGGAGTVFLRARARSTAI